MGSRNSPLVANSVFDNLRQMVSPEPGSSGPSQITLGLTRAFILSPVFVELEVHDKKKY